MKIYSQDKLIITTAENPITSVPEGYILYNYDTCEILTDLPDIFTMSGETGFEWYDVQIRFPKKDVKGAEQVCVDGEVKKALRHYLYTDLDAKPLLENSTAYVDGKTYRSVKGIWLENTVKNKK